MQLHPIDKKCALERIKQLDNQLFLTDDEHLDYQSRIEIVEEYDKQFRNGWKSDRRAWINAQQLKNLMTQEQAEEKLSQLDIDADLIIGKPKYPWSKTL